MSGHGVITEIPHEPMAEIRTNGNGGLVGHIPDEVLAEICGTIVAKIVWLSAEQIALIFAHPRFEPA